MVPSGRNAEKIVVSESLKDDVEFLCDSVFKGRTTGSKGAAEAAFWIARRFKNNGLMTFGDSWSQSFMIEGKVGHNIIGFMPGARTSKNESYVILLAHYDSYGMLDSKYLPGADSNASGVVAMLKIQDMLKYMKTLGRHYASNIIFLATDAKELHSAGAAEFISRLDAGEIKDPVSKKTIEKRQIKSTVVLDILGGTLEPLHKGRKDYLIMLSNPGDKYYLASANSGKGLGLDLGFDYYGSRNFTDLFRSKVGDQKIFSENGMPCVLFTSGITRRTNKETDDAESLNYDVFRQRVILIFHWLTKVL
jgi:Predicted aminopeptidases